MSLSEVNQEQPAEFGSPGIDRQVTTFFLACECRPGQPGFSVIDPFAYDAQPAWLRGTLGVLHYDPAVYAVVTVNPAADPLYGYVVTVSHPDTVALLDRMKGFFGDDGFNMHVRVLTAATVAGGRTVPAWVYVLSPEVISAYETIEQVEFGLWADDDKVSELQAEVDQDKPDGEVGE